MLPVKRALLGVLTLIVALLVVTAGAALWWLDRPLGMPASVSAERPLDITIAPGTSARGLASQLSRSGIEAPDWALFAYFRLSGDSRRIQAGSYEFAPGLTPKALLGKMVRGEQAFRQVTLIEGWNYRQVFEAVESARDVQQDTAALDVSEVMALIGKTGVHPEGQFFPDTYRFPKNAKASSVLRMASVALDRKLAQAWAERDDGLPLKSPREALILASIIEKEIDQSLARAATKVHETVDRVAATVTPVVDRMRSTAEGAAQQLQATAHDLVESRDQWMEEARSYVKERPLTTIGVTAVVALLIGRFWAR
jgi:UPF0755 protein